MAAAISLAFTLELSQIIVMVTSFVLAFLIWFIKVPATEHSRRLVKTKNSIATCFFVCAVLMYLCLDHAHLSDYKTFSALMMFVVTSVSSAVLSFSLINLLEERDNDKFYINLGIVILMSWALMRSFLIGNPKLFIIALVVYILLFVIQCVIHIVNFNKAYVNCVARLEQYYDDEEDHKVKWIRFCYIIMMLTQMAILVYMFLPDGFMKIYALWYVVFLVYFSANFISFLGSHKLLLDAFAYKALTFQSIKEKLEKKRLEKAHLEETPAEVNEAEFKRLEKALEKWVEEKRFREYDKSRDDIARELGTSKELLHLYFVYVIGLDFKTWRTNHRIEEAKKLLLDKKTLSINMVGEMAGFSDRSNFHRQFTKIVGCSPKQWRESGSTRD
jgi:AraC-like DNA-binding protein